MPTEFYLDFEEPLRIEEKKLEELKESGSASAVEKQERRVNKKREEIYSHLTRWQRVQISRHPNRPHSLDYINGLCDEFHEFHGDRNCGDDRSIICGIGTFKDRRVAIIGQQKGRNTEENIERNFGMTSPEGYRKALRIMKLAEKFHLPVLTLVDTPGAYPGIEAEEHGQGEAIARNLFEMSRLKTPIIVTIIGEGASGGALGIGVGDCVLMLESSWYSVISPESCSTILWRSQDKKVQAADALRVTAQDLEEMGLIDGIIPEPLGGAHRDPETMIETFGDVIVKHIDQLNVIDPEELSKKRIEKFSAMSKYLS